jgi:hypothetical protein
VADLERGAVIARQTGKSNHSRTKAERHIMRHILVAALVVASATAFTAQIASAKSGSPVGVGAGSRGASGPAVQAPKPTINSKIKLLNCHKYARGNGQGGINWVSVCS